MSELKPCPFCGSTNLECDDQDWDPLPVTCKKCRAEGPTGCDDIQETKDFWNKRFNDLEYLNEKHTYFSKELKIAIAAWEAVYQDGKFDSKQGHKKQILVWLNKQYDEKKLSNSARERIATLINPNKKGGAPSSESKQELTS
ncbi:MAG: hypothetical protein HN416_07065 [Nitrospina sp.]|jgi:hypothetical protein|nr:hypothetical protein [Nitrospina sp.]